MMSCDVYALLSVVYVFTFFFCFPPVAFPPATIAFAILMCEGGVRRK